MQNYKGLPYMSSEEEAINLVTPYQAEKELEEAIEGGRSDLSIPKQFDAFTIIRKYFHDAHHEKKLKLPKSVVSETTCTSDHDSMIPIHFTPMAIALEGNLASRKHASYYEMMLRLRRVQNTKALCAIRWIKLYQSDRFPTEVKISLIEAGSDWNEQSDDIVKNLEYCLQHVDKCRNSLILRCRLQDHLAVVYHTLKGNVAKAKRLSEFVESQMNHVMDHSIVSMKMNLATLLIAEAANTLDYHKNVEEAKTRILNAMDNLKRLPWWYQKLYEIFHIDAARLMFRMAMQLKKRNFADSSPLVKELTSIGSRLYETTDQKAIDESQFLVSRFNQAYFMYVETMYLLLNGNVKEAQEIGIKAQNIFHSLGVETYRQELEDYFLIFRKYMLI